ncbi:MAG: dTDP-4-dehydrorhamnose 3,5-epimerase [Candidatus Kapaibacterium sp.]
MGLEVVSEHLNGLIVLKPKLFGDERGFFMESWRADEFEQLGLPTHFVQDNHSRSARGVLRGMHFQWNPPQDKLIRVTRGRAYVVELDIRPGSPTLGKWFGIELSQENMLQLWVPAGFANGFCSLEDNTEMQYKVTSLWNKPGEGSICWDDPRANIDWPIDDPLTSEKDSLAMTLDEWLIQKESDNFMYE